MFRFTIRELLILTVTAGLAVGWWLDRNNLARQRDEWHRDEWHRAYIEEIWTGGGHVRFDYDDPATIRWLQKTSLVGGGREASPLR